MMSDLRKCLEGSNVDIEEGVKFDILIKPRKANKNAVLYNSGRGKLLHAIDKFCMVFRSKTPLNFGLGCIFIDIDLW